MDNYIEAQKLYDEDKYIDALGIYNRLIEKNPNDTVAYHGASKCLHRLNKLDEAINTCEKALEINEKLPLIHVILASVYNKLENREKSRKEAEIALSLDANSAVVLGCYGTSLLADNKLDEAISYLEKSVKVDNTDYVFHYNLAIAYSKDKRWGETIRELKNVYRLHPSVRTSFQIVIAYINKFKVIGSIGFLFLLTTIAAVAFSKKGLLIVSAFCLLFLLILDRVIKRVLS
jgi:tetratricopeptide (TPR) repeat protein